MLYYSFVILPPHRQEGRNAHTGSYNPLLFTRTPDLGIKTLQISPREASGYPQIPYEVPVEAITRILLHPAQIPLTPGVSSGSDLAYQIIQLGYPDSGHNPIETAVSSVPQYI